MQTQYNFASDSEEDEEDNLDEGLRDKVGSYQLQDIEKLKEQTKELLDPTWKETRNRHLLHKMLELEQPTITAKMVDFLLQEKVCELLVNFVTQNASVSPRPAPDEVHGEAMKLAYRAVLLLAPESVSDPLNAFLGRKTQTIARKMLEVFSLTSAGSFYHAYRVFECLLRSYPNEVFEGLQGDGQLSGRLDSVVRHIGYAPVCELLLMLVALTPLPRSSSIYVACVKQRGLFFDELGRYNLFRRLTEALVQTTSVCHTGAYVGSETHRSAAAQLLQDLVEKLSLEEQGEAWLTPLVAFDAATTQPCSVLQQLLNNMVDRDVDESVRRHCAKVVCFLLKRAAEQDIVCFVAGPNNGPPTASFLPNRLFPLRERIVTAVRDSVPRIVDCLATFDDERSGVAEGARGGDAKLPPFSSLRAYLVEVLALGVESDETVASAISERLWQRLIAWCLRYCGSNIYHALFYRLVFAVLRQGNEGVQRLLFQKARLVSFLVDNFLPYGDNEITGAGFEKGSAAYETRLRRLSVRGLLMNCANAIRLQLTLQPSNSFLPLFLAGLPKWEDFASQLRLATEKQMAFGMGIQVSQVDIKGGNRESAFALLATEAKPNEATLDSSVRFARSLGFLEEGDWTAPHFPSSSSSPDTAVPMPAMTEEHGSRLSYLADDTDDVSELMKALNSHEHGGSGQH